jgi:hypothetical protein
MFINNSSSNNGASSADELSLRASAQSLREDPVAAQLMAQLSAAVQSADFNAVEQIVQQIQQNPTSPLATILASPVDNVESVLRGAIPDNMITSIAGAKNHTLERLGKFVCASESTPSPKVLRALNKLISGKLSQVRWLDQGRRVHPWL